MFEKLLSLLLQAKGGAVATVFVLGTSGALVTATVDAGVTTLTITQPSSTTGSETTTPDSTTTTNTTVTDTILALFNRTNADEDPTSTATAKGNGCSDEAHARNEQMKRVNEASKDAREDVRALGKDAGKSADAKELVRDADTEIKDLRQAAVKDIHGTFDCDKDEDETTGTTSGTTNGTTSTTTNGDDAEAIADKATEDMEKVVEELEAALKGLEDQAPDEDDSDEATTSNEKQTGKSDKAKNDNKGKSKDKGNGKGRD